MNKDIYEIKVRNVFGQTHPFKMEFDPNYESDRNIKRHLEERGMYEQDVSKILAATLKPGDIFLDVGANVGWFSLLASRLVSPTGKVVAFEPAKENINKLKYNLSLNDMSNVELIETAVSDKTEETSFYLNPYGNGGHALWDMQKGREDRQPSEVIPITTITLDDWFFGQTLKAPRVLKIDTEGHDCRVLMGAKRLLDTYRPPYVISELHPQGLSRFDDNQFGMTKFMHDCGYEMFLLSSNFPIPYLIPQNTLIQTKWAQNLLFASIQDVGELCPILEVAYAEKKPA